MSKFDNQLRYAKKIIETYDGRAPLSVWLKDFFRENKQMGSKDRRTVSEMVYGYFRLGHNDISPIEERLKSFIFVSDTLPDIKEYFFPDGKHHSKMEVDKIFPFKENLSTGMDVTHFSQSFLFQPNLFIRVRPGNKADLIQKLVEQGVSYEVCEENCMAFSNGTRIEKVLHINREAVVQDRNSQRTGEFIKEVEGALSSEPLVWDCCAGSGGKSIMAYDIMQRLKLTASDIRKAILDNLAVRFSEAALTHYESFVADLTDARTVLPDTKYDMVIADVPCSGSGTWARTPEQLYFFQKERIKTYSDLQKKIVSRVIPSIKQHGYLLYITCSVFAEENEMITEYITSEHSMKLVRAELLKGYDIKADSLYAALFTN